MTSQAHKDRTRNRDKLRLAVAKTFADLNLDAILYPLQKILVAPVTAEDQLERNGTLSSGTGFPAVTFPAVCRLVPNCWASTTPKPDSSPLPTLSNRRAGFANRRKAHHGFPTSHSGERRDRVGTAGPHGTRAWQVANHHFANCTFTRPHTGGRRSLCKSNRESLMKPTGKRGK